MPTGPVGSWQAACRRAHALEYLSVSGAIDGDGKLATATSLQRASESAPAGARMLALSRRGETRWKRVGTGGFRVIAYIFTLDLELITNFSGYEYGLDTDRIQINYR